ncbi:hypothetical protein B5M09_006131 [Aphanomyces astaci]|uniref:HSF-type DNA-binding domain-containing protein n=1 Tax=Aphanomyces astaci TaxID=112090 RepID=A0A425D498_APHAT|nr:hypothetical protein B5M09_006131 [Aphanomyces astaci]
MLARCPSDVAAWNEAGSSFMVKDVSVLERRVLPQYFRHNHFASFTRQLRFYGFEKAKVPLIHTTAATHDEVLCWEFTHPKFLRDAPHKLDTIRRKTCTDPTPKWNADEVADLRSDLSTLQAKMSVLLGHVSTLATVLHDIAKDEETAVEWDAPSLWGDMDELLLLGTESFATSNVDTFVDGTVFSL